MLSQVGRWGDGAQTAKRAMLLLAKMAVRLLRRRV
jgi:hypothetical protein